MEGRKEDEKDMQDQALETKLSQPVGFALVKGGTDTDLLPNQGQKKEERKSNLSESALWWIAPGIVTLSATFLVSETYLFKAVFDRFEFSVHEYLAMRGLMFLILSLIGCAITGTSLFQLSDTEKPAVAFNSALLTACGIGYFGGASGVSVSLVTVIYCTFPMWAAVFGKIFLTEPIFLIDIICVVVGFIGLLFVVKQPSDLFGESNDEGDNSLSYVLLLIGSVITYSLIGVVSRKVKGKVHFFTMSFYMGNMIMSTEFLILYFGTIKHDFELRKFFSIIGFCAYDYFSQLL